MPSKSTFHGLSWAKRRSRTFGESDGSLEDALFGKAFGMNLADALVDACNMGKVCFTLREQFMTLTIAQLRQNLMTSGHVGSLPRGPKAKLVSMLLDRMPRTPDIYMGQLLPYGQKYLEGVRALCREGGVRRVAYDEVRSLDAALLPTFPVVELYDEDDTLVNVVPKEIVEILGKVDDETWEQASARAASFDKAFALVGQLCDLRGVVLASEAVDEYHRLDGAVADLGRWLSMGVGGRLSHPGFGRVTIDGELFLANSTLLDMAHMTPDGFSFDNDEAGYAEASFAQMYLEAHNSIPPRPLPDELREAGSVRDWVLSTDEAQAFLDFIDEHLPASAVNAGLDFAGVIAVKVVEELQAGMSGAELAEMLTSVLDGAGAVQTSQIRAVCEAFANKVPLWDQNGWSARELGTSGEHAAHPHLSLVTDEDKDADEPAMDATDAPRQAGPVLKLVEDDPASSEDSDAEFAEPDFDAMRASNKAYLGEFEDWLTASGLKPKTISNHLDNAWFYLDAYLCNYEGLPMEEGTRYSQTNGFFGNFFIRKAMWSTPATIRSTAASLKKFYKCMRARGHVEQGDLDELLADIKDFLPEWCDLCAEYNDPRSDNPFYF